MNYNRALHNDLREVISSREINDTTDLNNLYSFLNDADMTEPFKLYIDVENALYEVGGIDIRFMEDGNALNKVLCIRAKKHCWIDDYSQMNMDQLIEEYGKQNSRKATAVYKKTDFRIVYDAEDRMNYIQDRLRELRFGKQHDK